MKKEIVLILMMSSIGIMNAMDSELAQKKQNSTIPTMERQEFCCRRGSAVPVCDRCFMHIAFDNRLTIEKESSVTSKNKLSASQELRRCP